jgi:hypothetical protein
VIDYPLEILDLTSPLKPNFHGIRETVEGRRSVMDTQEDTKQGRRVLEPIRLLKAIINHGICEIGE